MFAIKPSQSAQYLGFGVVENSPYSLDLALSDYHIFFRVLKRGLGALNFGDSESVHNAGAWVV